MAHDFSRWALEVGKLQRHNLSFALPFDVFNRHPRLSGDKLHFMKDGTLKIRCLDESMHLRHSLIMNALHEVYVCAVSFKHPYSTLLTIC